MSEGPSSPSGVSPSKSPSRRLIRSPLSYGLAINPLSGSSFRLPTEFIKVIEQQKNELEGEEGTMQCPNKRIHEGDDILYHLGLSNRDNLRAMFGDVKFVLMGGSHERAETVANLLSKRLGLDVPVGYKLSTIGKTERFSMFKVGPVISINHGMGMPSMLILLHEITKMLYHARAKDVWYIRIGTSGGLGLPAGTVVVSEEGMNGKLEPFYEQIVLGRVVQRNTQLDSDLRQLALECAAREPAIPCVQGKTMGTDDFYEGQGRLDGAIVDYEEEERNAWLHKAHEVGVRNIEMEAPAFAAWCLRMNIPGLLCCAVLLNRLEGDQVKATHDELAQYSANAQEVAMRVIEARLGLDQPEVNEEAAATQ